MADWNSYGTYEIALLGIAAPPRPTECGVWSEWAKVLDAYFAKPRKTAVAVELWNDRARRIPVGKVSWSTESFAAWCEPSDPPKGRYFVSLDALTPPWAACKKRKELPDGYFQLRRLGKKGPASHKVLLAVREGVDVPSAVETARALCSFVSCVSLHRVTGPFAQPTVKRGGGGDGLSNALMDWLGAPPPGKTWKARKLRL